MERGFIGSRNVGLDRNAPSRSTRAESGSHVSRGPRTGGVTPFHFELAGTPRMFHDSEWSAQAPFLLPSFSPGTLFSSQILSMSSEASS